MPRRLLPCLALLAACTPGLPAGPGPAAPAPVATAPARAAARGTLVDALRLADRLGSLALAVHNDRTAHRPLAAERLLAAPPEAPQASWRYADAGLEASATVMPGGPEAEELSVRVDRSGRGQTGVWEVHHRLAADGGIAAGELLYLPDAAAGGAAQDVKFTAPGQPLRVSLAPAGGSGAGLAVDVTLVAAADGSLAATAHPGDVQIAVTYRRDGHRTLRCWGPGFGCEVADLDLDGRGTGGLYAGEPGAAARTGELALTGLAGGTLTFAGGAPATFSFAGGEAPPPPASPAPDAEPEVGAGRGIPAGGPWLAFYGSAGQLAARFGSLEEAARRFRLFVIDADPMANHFTPAQIATLKAGGANRVLSYLDVGSVEASRSYWSTVERAGYVPAKELTTAQLGPYGGYPDEVWMDPADRAWHHLLMGYAVPKLVAGTERGGQAVDGLFLDNMELAEHGDADANGPCNAACRYATYDVVRELRERYPRLLLVANGATDTASRAMAFGPARYAELLDGVVRESAFVDPADPQGREQLAAWRALGLWAGGRPTWIGTIDYVDACDATAARAVRAASEAEGFFPFVAGTLDHLSGLCAW